MRNRAGFWAIIALSAYVTLCSVAGIFVAEIAYHPQRRPVPTEDVSIQRAGLSFSDNFKNVAISTSDGVILRAWLIRPNQLNGDAVILLHGLSDNRLGMSGYARLLLARGYTVLMPDARAHGSSDGSLATYGLLERYDIHDWVEWIELGERPKCIFGLGESMGAAQLLQALAVEHRFCAVAAESPFSNFREIAYDRVGQFLHTGPWVGRTIFRPLVEVAFLYGRWKYAFDLEQALPEQAIENTRTPILLIHGKDDSNIPVRHSERIQAHNRQIVLWEVENTDHCGAISTHPQEFSQRLLAWFDSHRS